MLLLAEEAHLTFYRLGVGNCGLFGAWLGESKLDYLFSCGYINRLRVWHDVLGPYF